MTERTVSVVSLRSLIVLALLAAAPSFAVGQVLPPVAPLLPPDAIAESVAVLRRMDAAVASNQKDAEAWYRRGTVAWALAEQARRGVDVPGFQRYALTRIADTSLILALSAGRGNPRHMLTLGQYRLGVGSLSLHRVQAYRWFDAALSAARKGNDRAFHAEAAIEVGRVEWRRYDALANRRIETEAGATIRSLTAARQPSSDALRLSHNTVRYHVLQNTQALPEDLSGGGEYAKAELLFREAHTAVPADPRGYRQLAMLLAERERWSELKSLAEARTTAFPADAWGWFTLGLALRRQGDLTVSAAVFDSALTRVEPSERRRLDRMERVMSPSDTAGLVALTGNQREQMERAFWRFADPLWSSGGDDAHTEFLARVVFAELRWSVDELAVRGADSDRGRIYVRFGPPDVAMQLGPKTDLEDIGRPTDAGVVFPDPEFIRPAFGAILPADRTELDVDEVGQRASVTTIWAYSTGWLFFFRGAPTYATTYVPDADRPEVDTLVIANPARWANVAGVSVNPMRAIVSRFRAGADSVEFVVAVDGPVDEIREQTASNTKVRSDVWIFGRDVAVMFHDSAQIGNTNSQAWAFRVRAGTYGYRAEITSDAAMIAGRAGNVIVANTDSATGFTTRGFGISDLMLGKSGEPRGTPRRWSNVAIQATGGTVAKDSEVALVWENYDLGARDGSASYEIEVTVQREYAALMNRIRARIVGGIATVLGVDRTEGRVVFRFDRAEPHAPIIVEHMALSMEGAPAGDYRISVQVTDRVTGRSDSSVSRIVIPE